MNKYLQLLFYAGAILLLTHGHTSATHIKAGEITAKRISATSLTYDFTFIGYRDIDSPVAFGEGLIDFGDGTVEQIDIAAKSIEVARIEDLYSDGFEQIIIVIEHTFDSPGIYTVGYTEPNRNDLIVNMDNSVNTRFYVEMQVSIDPLIGMNSSPVFQTVPVDMAFVGITFTHNPWAVDAEGDSLSYKLVSVKQTDGLEVVNFRFPNSSKFYQSPIDYNSANEAGTGPPTFTIHNITGDLSWDAPGNYPSNQMLPEYNIAFMVEEWRKISGSWERIGYVVRDMLILVVSDFQGSRPNSDLPPEIPIEAEIKISETINFSDPDGDSIMVETYTDLYDLPINPAILSSIPMGFQPGPVSVHFDWTPNTFQLGDQPYLVHFKVTDKPNGQFDYPKTTYLTWCIEGFGDEIVTSIEEDSFESKSISLYPNPVTDLLKLKVKSRPQELALYITNHLGHTLYYSSNYGDLFELNVSNWGPGVYFLKAYSDNKGWTKKFIKL